MRNMLTMLFLLLLHLSVRAQSPITLQGRAGNIDGLPLSGVAIFLVHDGDTVASVFTRSDGTFAFPDTLLNDDVYVVESEFPCHHSSSVRLQLAEMEFDHALDLPLTYMRIMDCPAIDNSAYFAENDAKEILQFETAWLRRTIDQTHCTIRFSVTQLPGESKRLGRQRMRTFKKLLKEEQIAMQYIVLSPVIHYYDPAMLEQEPKRPAIQGIVTAMP